MGESEGHTEWGPHLVEGEGHGERRQGIQWNLRERDALGKRPMSLVERSSLSRRFVFFSLYQPNTSNI